MLIGLPDLCIINILTFFFKKGKTFSGMFDLLLLNSNKNKPDYTTV